MELKWKRTDSFLTIDDKERISCWCHVRNELNGKRSGKQVVYSMPEHKPYMPREFPVGRWTILSPIPKDPKDTYLYPFFIPTNAYQYLPVWILDAKGAYVKPDGDTVTKDIGYGLHFSSSDTTLGCLRIEKEAELRHLVDLVNASLARNEVCRLIVS